MVIKQFALFAFLVLAGLSNGQDMFGDDKHSYVLLPAEVVSSGIVSQVDFSPSRRYVIYRRADIATYEASLVNKDVPQKFQWFRYDTVSKVNQKIQVPESTQELMVLGDDQSVYYIGGELGKEQGFLDLRNGAITKTSFDLMTLVYTGDETFAPFFIFKTGDFNVQLLKPSGQTISFVLPVKLRYFRPIGSNAKTITFTAMGEGKRGNLTYHYGDAKAVFKELSSDELDKQRREAEPRNLFWFENIGDLAYVKLMDLPKNLVTDLPKMAKLGRADCLPRFGTNSVVYEDAGALLIREIKPLDTALARKLQMEAAKAKAMMNAKQAAVGLAVYASDMDNVLPGAEGWEIKVAPYFKNADFLKDFNYTFKGGDMGLIGSPATTELGFIMGPGGRAVAYADGHVTWVNNP